MFNNVFAWEGAVALAADSEKGKIGSHRFLTYHVDPASADPEYLHLFFSKGPGRDVLGRASPGSAGRNRTLSIERFASQQITLPPVIDQRRMVARVEELAAKVSEARALRQEALDETAALVTSMHMASAGDRHITFGQLLALDEDKVDVEPGTTFPRWVSGDLARVCLPVRRLMHLKRLIELSTVSIPARWF